MILPDNIKDLKISGIYCIKSTIDDRIYIGSSSNIRKRCREHFNALNKKHHNIKLRHFYNKYSTGSLEFKLLEKCIPEELQKREQYYIDKYNSIVEGFNIDTAIPSRFGTPTPEEVKEKIRLAMKFSDGTRLKMKISRNARCKDTDNRIKFNPNQVKLIKQLIYLGYKNKTIAKYYNVTAENISSIRAGSWKHINLIIPSTCMIKLIKQIIKDKTGFDIDYIDTKSEGPYRKLSIDDVEYIINNKNNFKRFTLARKFNVCEGLIGKVIAGKYL